MKKVFLTTVLFFVLHSLWGQLNIGANINMVKVSKNLRFTKESFSPYGLFIGYEFNKFTVNSLLINNNFILQDTSQINEYNIPIIFNTKYADKQIPISFNSGLVINNVFSNHIDKNLNKIKNSFILGLGYSFSLSYRINNKKFEIGSIFSYDLTDNYNYRYTIFLSYQFSFFNKQ